MIFKRPVNSLVVLFLPVALFAFGCDVSLAGDDEFYLCDQNNECRADYQCRSVNGRAACVPEKRADQFPALGTTDATSDTTDNDSSTDTRDDTAGDTTGDTENDATDTDADTGPSDEPCVDIAPAELNFPEVTTGETASRSFTVSNCSDGAALTLQDVALRPDSDAAFTLAEGVAADLPIALDPRGSQSVTVNFLPSDLQTYEGAIEIELAEVESTEVVVLTGEGVAQSSNQCPQAAMNMSADNGDSGTTLLETEPLQFITLDAGASTDPDNDSLEYRWTLESKPQHSRATLPSSTTVPTVSLDADLVGKYEVLFDVVDSQGRGSCNGPILLIVEAYPNEEVYVELTWRTDGYNGPIGDSGTDLDLHYARGANSWGTQGEDVYWKHPTTDWGTAGDPADNPELVLDNVDGAGPEVVTHPAVPDGTYFLAAYYYQDENADPARDVDATIRVYQDQVEVFSNTVTLTAGELWEAASISMPSGTIDDIDEISEDYSGQ